MTDLRAGATHHHLPAIGSVGEGKGKFLDPVPEVAAGEFEILGELGFRPDGGIAYLAGDLSRPRLVGLRFLLIPGSENDYVLDKGRAIGSRRRFAITAGSSAVGWTLTPTSCSCSWRALSTGPG